MTNRIINMKSNRRMLRLLLVGVATGTLLAGCAVGPDFKKPAPPDAKSYSPEALPDQTASADVHGGEAQHFVGGQDISADWWTLFHSEPLNALIARALKNNPDISSAQAALDVAREMMRAQVGAYYPQVTAGFSASRQRTSAAIAPVPNANLLNFSLYTPEVSVSYTPDVFGLNGRTIESLEAQAEATRFALVATQITLTSNVVAAAIQEATLSLIHI